MEKLKNKRYLVAVALATVVVIVFSSSPAAVVESVYPFNRVRAFLRGRLFPSLGALFRASSVANENRRLRCEMDLLRLEQGHVARLEAENARLRTLLAFRARARENWLPAEVLSFGGSAGVHHLICLSKGAKDGVAPGMAVAVPEGLVGRVVSVTPHTCSVLLVSDPTLRVACEIETAPGSELPRGILCGGDEDRMEIRHLTRATGLCAANQRVITSGLGGVFPRGIVVGRFVGREGLTGFVRLTADLTALEFVFIRCEN